MDNFRLFKIFSEMGGRELKSGLPFRAVYYAPIECQEYQVIGRIDRN